MLEQNSLKQLATKMTNVMKDVGYIKKAGRNEFHGYNYATEADIAAAFSKALHAHNVFMFSNILERSCTIYKTRGQKDSFLVTVKLEVTFVDADSGESFSSTFYGDGSDPDDKGVYKATTGALKCALMKTFLVATGDDPEQETSAEQQTTPTQSIVAQKNINIPGLKATLESVALQGEDALREAWGKLRNDERRLMVGYKNEFKRIATSAGNRKATQGNVQ